MTDFPHEMGPSEKMGIDFVAKPLAGKEEPSLLNRFVGRIRNTFFQQPQSKLAGRVHELTQNTDEVLKRLDNIKEELRTQIDGDLYKYVESAIDPMSRDVKRIQKLMEKKGSPLHQAAAFKKYNEWIEKAKLWVGLESRIHDKKAVIEAIIKHTFAESDELIDHDLQVIREYEAQIVANLPISDEERNSITHLINLKLQPHIQALAHLKHKPPRIELGKVTHWRSEVDRKRNMHHDDALHDIDEVIQEVAPTASNDSENEHILEVFEQVVTLEEDIPKFIKEYEVIDPKDEDIKNLFQARLKTFLQEIHQLSLDLRLTPQLYERLQVLQDLLVKDKSA